MNSRPQSWLQKFKLITMILLSILSQLWACCPCPPPDPPVVEINILSGQNQLSMAVQDEEGNVYVTGGTTRGLGEFNLGENDIFLVKLGRDNTVKWTEQFGTTADDFSMCLAIDKENIFIAGYTGGTIGDAEQFGGDDVFLIKLNLEGKQIWSTQFGSEHWDTAQQIKVDSSGNIFIIGETRGSINGQPNAGLDDVFITKYSSTGTMLWVTQIGSKDWDAINALDIDNLGNIYVTGLTSGEIDGIANSGISDLFISKINEDGALLWTKKWGTASYDSSFSIKISSDNFIYVTGQTDGSFNMDFVGQSDVFIWKLDLDGNIIWQNGFGSTAQDYGAEVFITKDNLLYVVGQTYGKLSKNERYGQSDIFIAELNNANGETLWLNQFGSENQDQYLGGVLEMDGDFFIPGIVNNYFEDEIEWDVEMKIYQINLEGDIEP